MQKTIEELYPAQHEFNATYSINKGTIEKNRNKQQKKQKTGNAGCWVVGLGGNLRGRRESVLKMILQTFPPNPLFTVSAFLSSSLQGFESLKPPIIH
jgi:hypothetical protein